MGYIYGLHLGDGLFRYVGKTVKTPEKRLAGHFSEAKMDSSLPVHRWIVKHGREKIFTEPLDSCDDEEFLLILESLWISKLRNAGFDLLNLTDGGEGLSGYKMTEAQKALLSAYKLGKPGRPHTEEHRAYMSQIMKGRKITWIDKVILTRGDKFKGAGNPRAVLSEDQVVDILNLLSLDEWPCPRAIAEFYGVNNAVVENIARGKTWSHMPRPPTSEDRKRVVGPRARLIVDAAFAARRGVKDA